MAEFMSLEHELGLKLSAASGFPYAVSRNGGRLTTVQKPGFWPGFATDAMVFSWPKRNDNIATSPLLHMWYSYQNCNYFERSSIIRNDMLSWASSIWLHFSSHTICQSKFSLVTLLVTHHLCGQLQFGCTSHHIPLIRAGPVWLHFSSHTINRLSQVSQIIMPQLLLMLSTTQSELWLAFAWFCMNPPMTWPWTFQRCYHDHITTLAAQSTHTGAPRLRHSRDTEEHKWNKNEKQVTSENYWSITSIHIGNRTPSLFLLLSH